MPAAFISLVELRAGAVDHDRRQAHLLQERQRSHQRLEFIAQDRAAHLHHGEARRIELREALEVLLDFLGAGHVGQQPDDGGTQVVGMAGRFWFGVACNRDNFVQPVIPANAGIY